MSDKTSDKRLLPCPFCGGEALLTNQISADTYGHKLWNVICIKCDNGTMAYWDKNHVIDKWNTRTPVEQDAKKVVGQFNLFDTLDVGICPSCGDKIYRKVPYCSKCGQKVEWR